MFYGNAIGGRLASSALVRQCPAFRIQCRPAGGKAPGPLQTEQNPAADQGQQHRQPINQAEHQSGRQRHMQIMQPMVDAVRGMQGLQGDE